MSAQLLAISGGPGAAEAMSFCCGGPASGLSTWSMGQKLLLRGSAAPTEGPAYTICLGTPVAVGVVEDGCFVSTRVFNLPD